MEDYKGFMARYLKNTDEISEIVHDMHRQVGLSEKDIELERTKDAKQVISKLREKFEI